jgi:hypothetical protein
MAAVGDAVLAMSCYVRDASIFVDAEIIDHRAARDEFWLAGWIVHISSTRTRINGCLFVEL